MATQRYNKDEWGKLYTTKEDVSVKDKPSWIDTNKFNSTYYNGLDISVYFNDIYIDEVVSLQFQESEQVRPNFGYESYTMKSVSYGSRLVQGSFTINFKDSGYIHKIIQYMKDTAGETAILKTLAKSIPNGPKNLSDITKHKAALLGDFTVEDFLNGADSKDDEKAQRYSTYMDALDAAYWGEYTNQKNLKVNEDLVRARSSAYMNRPKFYTTESGIEIVIKHGQPEEGSIDPTKPVKSYGTIEIIKNCHLGTFAKAMDDSGRNTLEVYSFIASTVA